MSEPNREARRRRIVERVKTGETRQEIMQNENISRVTLWSDLKALDALFLTENSVEIKELKRRVGHALLENADNVLSGNLAPDQANAWRGIMADFSQLFGLNSPSKSIQAHVSSESRLPTPEENPRFWRFKSCVERLDDVLFEKVCLYAKKLDYERYHPPQPLALPDASEGLE
jgi:hypothetical protein